MSDRLEQGLQASSAEIEAGLGEAQEELDRLRHLCRETEGLIAKAKAVLLAAQTTGSTLRERSPSESPSAARGIQEPVGAEVPAQPTA